MAQFKIARRSHPVRRTTIAIVVLSLLVSPVFAQTYHEFFGPTTPLVFDAAGARHWCLYGYYGPFTPPLTFKDANMIITCKRGSGAYGLLDARFMGSNISRQHICMTKGGSEVLSGGNRGDPQCDAQRGRKGIPERMVARCPSQIVSARTFDARADARLARDPGDRAAA